MAILGNKSIKEFTGIVVSDKMQNTIVVEVKVVRTHPKYRKRFTIKKKFYAHNPESKAKVGDTVTIRETKPMSKTKRRIVV